MIHLRGINIWTDPMRVGSITAENLGREVNSFVIVCLSGIVWRQVTVVQDGAALLVAWYDEAD